MASPNQSRHFVPHRSGRQVLEASRDSLIKNGLTDEQYALTKGVGHTAAITIQEVGSVDPLSELGAGGHLASAITIMALAEQGGLSPDIDWAAFAQTSNAIASKVGSGAAAEIAKQPAGLHAVPDQDV